MTTIYKSFASYLRSFTKWHILLIVIAVLYVLLLIRRQIRPEIEGFEQKENYKTMSNDDIYDTFYTDIYDELFLQPYKIETEVGEILTLTKLPKSSKTKILDIGCGKGHHLDHFQKMGGGVNATGLDKSSAMIAQAKELYPKVQFLHGDANDAMSFGDDTFDMITCFTFTVYYLKDKRRFFQNCYKWLKNGGYLAVHLVDRNKFDPIVPAGKPLLVVSPQKYAKTRITNSVVKFNKFDYKADFSLSKNNKDEATFEEKIVDDKTGKVRENIHKYYMPTRRDVIDIAKEVGFSLSGQFHLVKCMNEYQYIYIFRKSN